MTTARQIEIDHNYDFFRRNLLGFLEGHAGQFALLKNSAVIDWFDRPGEAYRAGLAMFSDAPFSIQEARSDPIELGHLALG
jgi:hypothetical protein